MNRPSPEEWLKLCAEYETSGMTLKEFVAQHDVSSSTFEYWLYRKSKRFRKESGSTTQFVPIELVRSPALKARVESVASSAMAGGVEVELPSAVRLRFGANVPARYVAELVGALR